MPDCYYTCNLIPLELPVGHGYTVRWLGNHLRTAEAPVRRDALSVHPMTCPFVTKLVAAADELLALGTGAGGNDLLVVPGGCDAMRRMGDLIAATYPDQTFVLPVPRSFGPDVEERLAADLRLLHEWLAGKQAEQRDASESEASFGQGAPLPLVSEPPRLDYPVPPRPGGVFVVSGPLSDSALLDLISRLGAHVSGLESCTSPDRWKPLAPSAEPSAHSSDYAALAAKVLEAGMCPRRSTAERRDHLRRRLDATNPASIIYARQSFCDPGAYDALLVASLAAERGLPFLEIEVDFPFDPNGPLRTRVEAFLEAQLLDEDLLGSPDDDLFAAADADLFDEEG
jgi:hypothetical protein